MNAKITATADTWKQAKHYDDKETTETYNAVVFAKGEIRNPVTVKIYMGRSASASRVYATIWAAPRDGRLGLAGSGYADGGGYHKPSAALSCAIEAAGIELSEDIDGRGDWPMRDAIEAITRACGYRGKCKVV